MVSWPLGSLVEFHPPKTEQSEESDRMLQLSPKKPLHHSALTVPLTTLWPLLNSQKQDVGWDEGQSATSAQSVLDLLFNLRMWICVISNLSFWHLNWNWDRKSSILKPKSHYCYCHHDCLKSVVTRHKRNIVKGEMLANCFLYLLAPTADAEWWGRSKLTLLTYLS